jgi:hypothetical protein
VTTPHAHDVVAEVQQRFAGDVRGRAAPRDRVGARGAAVTVEVILARLEHVRRTRRGWTARCPAHPDRSPSLSIAQSGDGQLLLHCFAGCRFSEIAAAIGWEHRSASRHPARPRSLLETARHEALAHERASQRRRDASRRLMGASDRFREAMRQVDAARRVATIAGPSEDVWELLALAADAERLAHADLEAAVR